MITRDTVLPLIREVLALRSDVQQAHDAHLLVHLADHAPGSPLEQHAQNLSGMLLLLDETYQKLRAVVETLDVVTRNAPAVEAWKTRGTSAPGG